MNRISLRWLPGCTLLCMVIATGRSLAGGSLDAIDMEEVVIGSYRDSTVAGYLTNSGSRPRLVDSIRIVGADASSFELLYPLDTITIGPARAISIRLRFEPRRPGIHQAVLESFSLGIASRGTLRGEGRLPALIATQDTIDFGEVRIGDFRDSSASLVRNITTTGVDIPVVVQDGPDVALFLVTGGDPTVLPAGAVLGSDIRFSPTGLGLAVSRLVFNYVGPGSPAQVILIGRGVDPLGVATLEAPAVTARVGEIVEIPIRLRNARNLGHAEVTGFHVDLRFDASMLLPVAPTPIGFLDGDERVIRLDIPLGAGTPDSILATFRFRAAVGSDTMTPLLLTDPVATGGSASLLVIPGSFVLTGLCESGGTRRVDAGGDVVLKQTGPGSTDGSLRLDLELVEDGPTRLLINDLAGARVATLLDDIMRPGLHSISAAVDRIPAGIYLCVLETPTEVRSIMVRVGW